MTEPDRKYGHGLVKGQARLRVFERFGYRCAYCKRQFTPTGDPRYAPSDQTYRDKRGRPRICLLEVDHIIPRSAGGTNDPANLQALCTQCNVRKGHKVECHAG